MAWTTPLTAVANTAFTAAQFNASVRDNLLETAPAKATTTGRWFVSSAANTIAERSILDAVVETSQTTTSATYANLTTNGPEITLTTGAKAFVFINAWSQNTIALTASYASFGITGATTNAPSDGRAVTNENSANAATSACRSTLIDCTGGSNVFLMQYRVGGGTGTFQRRRMQVMAM